MRKGACFLWPTRKKTERSHQRRSVHMMPDRAQPRIDHHLATRVGLAQNAGVGTTGRPKSERTSRSCGLLPVKPAIRPSQMDASRDSPWVVVSVVRSAPGNGNPFPRYFDFSRFRSKW